MALTEIPGAMCESDVNVKLAGDVVQVVNTQTGALATGTTTFNGVSGTRVLGGAMASSITITEYKA